MASSKRSVTVFFAAVFLIGGSLSHSRNLSGGEYSDITPQRNGFCVSKDKSVKLTWKATRVCKIQITCNGEKFGEGDRKVCRKTCQRCNSSKTTVPIKFFDSLRGKKALRCQTKFWAINSTKTEKIITLREASFGQFLHVVHANDTVILRCSPPNCYPPPNITWYKDDKQLVFCCGRSSRASSNKLVIKGVNTNDSGNYHCVAKCMAAPPQLQKITLAVRGGNPRDQNNGGCDYLCVNLHRCKGPRCRRKEDMNFKGDGETYKKTQIPQGNPCDQNNSGCDYLCVNQHFSEGPRCMCQKDMNLKGDGKTCEKAQERTEEPKNAQESTDSDNGSFPVWGVVIIVVVALLALLLAVYIIVKKRFSHFIQVDLNVREHIGEESTTERRGFVQESLPPSFVASAVLSRQLCNAEPLGAGATGENSSVRRGDLVIYNNYNRVTTVNLNTQLNTVNTKMHTTNNYNVELEQNGGMTVEDME